MAFCSWSWCCSFPRVLSRWQRDVAGMSPEPKPILQKPILNVAKLVKRFCGFHALDGLSFHVAAREIFGLVRPNGSRKTTAITAVSVLYPPHRREEATDG